MDEPTTPNPAAHPASTDPADPTRPSPGVAPAERADEGRRRRHHESRRQARRLEAQRRIDREHRRAQLPRIGWDWSPRGATGSRGRAPRRRRRTTPIEVAGVAAVAVVSAAALWVQDTSPTDNPTADLVVGTVVAVAVAVLGAVVSRHLLVAWGLVATVATTGRRFLGLVTFNTLAAGGWQLLAGLVAIVLASGVALIDRRGRTVFAPVLGAASASLSLQCLASLPQRNWPVAGLLVVLATGLGALWGLALRVRPAWLFD